MKGRETSSPPSHPLFIWGSSCNGDLYHGDGGGGEEERQQQHREVISCIYFEIKLNFLLHVGIRTGSGRGRQGVNVADLGKFAHLFATVCFNLLSCQRRQYNIVIPDLWFSTF